MKTKEEIVDVIWRHSIPKTGPEFEDFIASIQTDAQAHLLERIKVLEVERDAFKRDAEAHIVSLNAAGKFVAETVQKLSGQRDQAHSALKCALDALVKCQKWPQVSRNEHINGARSAIAQIHACGIDGESKEHPGRNKELHSLRIQYNSATAILRRNLASLRADVNLKGQVNQQRHDDYLEACRICGVEP